MTTPINPRNKTAQLHHRGVGNPVSALPVSAISNCFPGLELDFKNFWRRAFVGVVLLECDNYVVETDEAYGDLLHHRLLLVDGRPVVTQVVGPHIPGSPSDVLGSASNPSAMVAMEWSNVLAFVLLRQGHAVTCHFTRGRADSQEPIPADPAQMLAVDLTVRRIFDGDSAAPAEGLIGPGELTQGLCSPWQHDYRECACYYWPATRPDYVNIEPTPEGVSRGDNWLAKERSGEYVLDDRRDSRLASYLDLFKSWEKMLRFQIEGRDAEES